MPPLSMVLIESDWNLKSVREVIGVTGSVVLIESDWNLKMDIIAEAAEALEY